jgi:hypothetical protein
MEMSQGNSMCNYLRQTNMSLIFFYKIRGQEGGTDPVWGVGISGDGKGYGESVWEGEYGANTVYMYK